MKCPHCNEIMTPEKTNHLIASLLYFEERCTKCHGIVKTGWKNKNLTGMHHWYSTRDILKDKHKYTKT